MTKQEKRIKSAYEIADNFNKNNKPYYLEVKPNYFNLHCEDCLIAEYVNPNDKMESALKDAITTFEQFVEQCQKIKLHLCGIRKIKESNDNRKYYIFEFEDENNNFMEKEVKIHIPPMYPPQHMRKSIDLLIEDTIDKELELHSDELNIQTVEKAKELLPYVKNHCIDMLVSYCDGKTEIKEWERDDCPYDSSGEVYSTHEFLTMETTVEEVLENYTGNREPTFLSGHGWNFLNLKDEMYEYIKEISDELTLYVIEQYFLKKSIPFDRDHNDIDMFYYVEPFRVEEIFDVEDMFDSDMKIKDLLSQKEDLPENELWDTITSKK